MIRVHGGARVIPELTSDYSYRLSSQDRINQKTTIGLYAAGLIRDLGADGIDLRNGLMTIDERTAKMNEIVVPALLNRGVLAPDARDYAIIGCAEPSICRIFSFVRLQLFPISPMLEG